MIVYDFPFTGPLYRRDRLRKPEPQHHVTGRRNLSTASAADARHDIQLAAIAHLSVEHRKLREAFRAQFNTTGMAVLTAKVRKLKGKH